MKPFKKFIRVYTMLSRRLLLALDSTLITKSIIKHQALQEGNKYTRAQEDLLAIQDIFVSEQHLSLYFCV